MNETSPSLTNAAGARAELRSHELFQRARQVIPGGVNSPVRAFRSVGGTPLYMKSGEGCYLIDADDNTFIDFCNSWGPLLTGHRHPAILAAIREQIDRALTFGTPCEPEVLLAEYVIGQLKAVVPGIEKIRFTSSGTEAVMSALRLARGFTGRNKIVKFEGCYHGHVDSLLVKAGSGLVTSGVPDSAGVPAELTAHTLVLPLNDETAVQKLFESHGADIAAVIIEPVPANNGLLLQRPEYLSFLARTCRAAGALLIFDEVISGFRVGFGGAAQYYNIQPDLVTYGKIIGGGMPVGAFAGRDEIFAHLAPDGPVYQAGTLSGNPVAMAAGLAQLKLLDDTLYKNLERMCQILIREFNAAGFPWKMTGIHSIFWMYEAGQDGAAPRRADQIRREAMQTYARLFRHCLDRGIYLAPSGYEVGFLSSPMSEVQIYRFLEVVKEFFSKDATRQP